MKSNLRRRLLRRPSPALAISIIALAVASAGVAHAGGSFANLKPQATASTGPFITGMHVADGTLSGADIGDNTLTGADINEATLGQVPSAANATHATSATTAAHATVADSAPYIGTLPTGKTLVGAYATRGTEQYMYAYISFPLRISTGLTPHIIPSGTTPPAACPGTLTNPQASAGHLCIYENNTGITSVFDPATISFTTIKNGATLFFNNGSAGTDHAFYGTWAATSSSSSSHKSATPALQGPSSEATGRP